jgi:DNA oxidative demethylase
MLFHMQIKPGLDYLPNYLSISQLNNILQDVQVALGNAPLFTPCMPRTGKKLSVSMSNMGNYGWVSDKSGGYRYQDYHPFTGNRWPQISDSILKIWREVTNLVCKPDCCLINFYNLQAKMGLHLDNDEKDFSYPVVSISIGNTALFRFGGQKRSDKTQSIKLNNGDVLIMGQESRLIYHGIDRIYPSEIYDNRINLTLRKI